MKKTILFTMMSALAMAIPAAAQTSPGNRSGATDTASPHSSSAMASGITVIDGVTYMVHDGKATRVTTSNVPSGQMMTADGKLVPLPKEVTGIPGSSDGESSRSDKSTSPSTPSSAPSAATGQGTGATVPPTSGSGGANGSTRAPSGGSEGSGSPNKSDEKPAPSSGSGGAAGNTRAPGGAAGTK